MNGSDSGRGGSGSVLAALLAAALALPLPTARAAAAFSVQPVFTPGQAPHNHAYYEVDTRPGERLTLQALITNHEDHAITVALGAHTAYTNTTGSIVYTGGGEGAHLSPSLAFSRITSPQAESLRIPAHETARAAFDVTMPGEAFDGIVLGGLSFSEPLPPPGSPGIRSIVQYVLGVVLLQGAGAEEPARLSLGPSQASGRGDAAVLSLCLVNESAAIVRPVDIHIRLTDARGVAVLTRTLSGWALAPSSRARLEVPLEAAPPPGRPYTLTVRVRAGPAEGGQSFLFHQSLYIDEQRGENHE